MNREQDTGRDPDPPEGAGGVEVVNRHGRLVARTFLVAGLTFVSRILGFVREMVMAALFGDKSAVADAFFTAFRVPNLFRRLFGEGALSTSLQAAITEADAEEGNAAGRGLFLRTISLTAWILLGVSALSMLLVSLLPDAMPGTGWPWLGADPAPVRDLTVRLMPFVFLVCLAALCGGALHVRGHYAVPNLAPSVANLIWIATLVSVGFAFGWAGRGEGAPAGIFQTQWDMARWLAWGVLFGGAVQLLLHIPPLVRHGLLPRRGRGAVAPTLAPAREAAGGTTGRHRTAWGVLWSSAPLAVGAAVYQINVMIDGLMAEGLLEDGGPTVLYYANRIQQFPLALVAISAVNAVFPKLKALGHTDRLGEMRELHDRSQLGVAFLSIPAAVGLLALSGPLAAVLFERGNFGPAGVDRMALALDMLALALVPAGAAALMARAYYARGDFRTPVRISCVLLVGNVGLNVLFVRGARMDAEGLALATAITTWGNLLWLRLGLARRLGLPASTLRAWSRLLRVGLAALACGVAAAAAHWMATSGIGLEGDAGRRSGFALLAATTTGAGTFLLLARWLRIPEWIEFRERVRRRLAR